MASETDKATIHKKEVHVQIRWYVVEILWVLWECSTYSPL